MQYMMAPLNAHYDSGFGATAESFHRAAIKLRDTDKHDILFVNLPVGYLLRHAIELFLKSSILIVHRKLRIPLSNDPADIFPLIPTANGKTKPMHQVHQVAPLFQYWKMTLLNNADALQKRCTLQLDLNIPKELDTAIDFIESTDPKSTRYRYPSKSDPAEDEAKSPFKEVSMAQLFPQQTNLTEPQKRTIALVVENQDREFITAYRLDEDTEKEALEALSVAADILSDFHAMMRIAVTDGW
jgi:hypothetical protein